MLHALSQRDDLASQSALLGEVAGLWSLYSIIDLCLLEKYALSGTLDWNLARLSVYSRIWTNPQILVRNLPRREHAQGSKRLIRYPPAHHEQ